MLTEEVALKRHKRLKAHREFLQTLYTGSKWKVMSTLTGAETSELDCLLKVFNYMASGEIPLCREQFDKVRQAKKVPVFMRLSTKDSLNGMMNSSDAEKKKYLKKFTSLYNALLFPLFNDF